MKKSKWGIIIGLILFPIVVQGLFCLHPHYRFLVANWSAGEILTYVGTAFLGFVAYVQNENMKEANDKAQDELAKLSSESNELSILARIIDYELNKKADIEKSISEFEEAANPQFLIISIDLKGFVDLKSLVDKERLLTEKYLHLCSAIGMKYDDVNLKDEFGLFSSIRGMYESTLNAIRVIKDEHQKNNTSGNAINSDRVNNAIDDMKNKRKRMEECICFVKKETFG